MNVDKGTYNPEHYNDIFLAMRHEFGESWYSAINPFWWNIWRKRIKKMFDEDITIREIKLALVEAAGKKRWPIGTSFFTRVYDVVLKNRIEAKRYTPVKEDRGLQPISFPHLTA